MEIDTLLCDNPTYKGVASLVHLLNQPAAPHLTQLSPTKTLIMKLLTLLLTLGATTLTLAKPIEDSQLMANNKASSLETRLGQKCTVKELHELG